jgi:excinuclease ABC subunit A
MVSLWQNQRFDYSRFSGKRINILAPVIRARKGHYGTFQQIAKQGFLKVRVNGDVLDITLGMKLDRYKTHDINCVDRMVVDDTLENENVNRKHQYRHESR